MTQRDSVACRITALRPARPSQGAAVLRFWCTRRWGPWRSGNSAGEVFDVPDKYWCTARGTLRHWRVSLSVVVPYAHIKWLRGRETTERSESTCPDENCCRRLPASLTSEGSAMPGRLPVRPGARAPAGRHAARRGRDRGQLVPAGKRRQLVDPGGARSNLGGPELAPDASRSYLGHAPTRHGNSEAGHPYLDGRPA